MWLDAAHGCCMRRRVWFHMTNVNDAAVLAYVYVNQEFHKCADETWLPQRCYRIDFGGAHEPPSVQGQLTQIHAVVAKTITVNAVPDDLFEMQFPPGTAVRDLISNRSYIIPHGENLLDDAIARADQIVNGEVKPRGSLSSPIFGGDRRWLIVADLLALGFLVPGLLRRGGRRHGSGLEPVKSRNRADSRSP